MACCFSLVSSICMYRAFVVQVCLPLALFTAVYVCSLLRLHMREFVAKGASAIETKQRFSDIVLHQPSVVWLSLFLLVFLDLPCFSAVQISTYFRWYYIICTVSAVIYPLGTTFLLSCLLIFKLHCKRLSLNVFLVCCAVVYSDICFPKRWIMVIALDTA